MSRADEPPQDEPPAVDAAVQGQRLFAAGDFARAERLFRLAAAQAPDDPLPQANLGGALIALGRAAEALPHLEFAAARAPGLAAVQANLGWALRETGRARQGIEPLRLATVMAPDAAAYFCNLGVALRDCGELDESEQAFRRAADLEPASAQALSGLGLTLKAQKRLGEAARALGDAIRAEPGKASSFNNLGNVLAAMGRRTPALMAYRAALRRDPDHVDALSNMGVLLRQAGRLPEALTALRRAAALAPRSATAAFNLANALAAERHADAGAAYAKAIALRPQWASAHLNHALWLLRQGLYAEGFAEYEWRWAMPDAQGLARRLDLPRWSGQAVDGKTVLVTAEQGLGDAIQCARYLPLLAARGARVLVEAKPTLAALLADVEGVAGVVAPGDFLGPVDLQCPLFSLPHAFGITLETVPPDTPYLRPPQALVRAWAERLPPGPKVGLVWQGNPKSRVEAGRSFPLAALAPALGAAPARFVSLQRDHGLDQMATAGLPVLDLGPDFHTGTMQTTAAILANLDLVIACDSAVAHLAGALGRPVWIALKRRAEWRWLEDRADSPWYPTARLYRQTTDGGWGPVFAAMADDLAAGVDFPSN